MGIFREEGDWISKVLVRSVGEVTMVVDATCVVLHDGDRLRVEVFEHFIRAPLASVQGELSFQGNIGVAH